MDLRFLDAPSKPPALEAYAARTWKDLWVKGSRPGRQGGDGKGTEESEALQSAISFLIPSDSLQIGESKLIPC